MTVSFVWLPNPFSVRYFTRHHNAINDLDDARNLVGLPRNAFKLYYLLYCIFIFKHVVFASNLCMKPLINEMKLNYLNTCCILFTLKLWYF
ncbi:hypothetical protein HanPSC8_Chr10g0431561 [Helianthus annuus]|nr:hypothetical protein HanPSC8_Chr10g0431561 [Helianthus annuus]